MINITTAENQISDPLITVGVAINRAYVEKANGTPGTNQAIVNLVEILARRPDTVTALLTLQEKSPTKSDIIKL